MTLRNDLSKPTKEITIVGGGIIGILEAYYAWQEAERNCEQVAIRILEKNGAICDTTTINIWCSLTPDEIISVVPRGEELVRKFQRLFSYKDPQGLGVEDVKVQSPAQQAFMDEAKVDSENTKGYEARTQALLELGKAAMDSWEEFFNEGDEEIKSMLRDSNYNPCNELKVKLKDNDVRPLHKGYRIDLIKKPDAIKLAEGAKKDYEKLGYVNCTILTPKQVLESDSSLKDFVERNSTDGVWHQDVTALYRPGGCINTRVFLPRMLNYLKQKMGERFSIEYDKEVTDVVYHEHNTRLIKGLCIGPEKKEEVRPQYKKSEYVFCPGEAIGTLSKLGFKEPASTGFAGTSLTLTIPIPENFPKEKLGNNCMEVHHPGIVLAWQMKYNETTKCMVLGVAGTKTLYGDEKPQLGQNYPQISNLLQLNIINDVYPDLVALALGDEYTREYYPQGTKGKKLVEADLRFLLNKKLPQPPAEEKGNIAPAEKGTTYDTVARAWVGRRNVAFDGVPVLGVLWKKVTSVFKIGKKEQVVEDTEKVLNGRCTTGLSSGGASFAHAAIKTSRSIYQEFRSTLDRKMLQFSSAKRHAKSDAELRKAQWKTAGFFAAAAAVVLNNLLPVFSGTKNKVR